MSVLKPIYLIDALGEYARMPDGSTVNIGGVAGPTFFVDGKPLLFADGSATDGSTPSSLNIDFQTVYERSVGEAFIDFTSNKDFVLQAVNDKQFRFDADTGLVTITGDMVVHGELSSIIHTSIIADKVIINQTSGSYIPFVMEPVVGITPTVNVMDVKVVASGASVFTVGPTGVTYIQSLNTGGPINGVDLSILQMQVDDHLDIVSTDSKHTAVQISVDASTIAPITGSTVQAALESIGAIISNMGSVRGYEHTQNTPSTNWIVTHNQNTARIQVTVWNTNGEVIFADTIKITNPNTVTITFNTLTAGRAVLMLF